MRRRAARDVEDRTSVASRLGSRYGNMRSLAIWDERNRRLLVLFAPLLILAGVLGFIVPERLSLMSGAAPYNWFHLAFGVLGLLALRVGSARGPVLFNLGFGLIDLWQVVAGVTGWFPAELFALRPADHVLHVVFGLVLTGAGVMGLRARS
jgi:hypothetical protein